MAMAKKQWSSTAPPGEFHPYIPAEESIAEFTLRAVVLGSLFGLLFGAVTVYVGLRAGLTVSASIPIAVLSISIFARVWALDDSGKQHRANYRVGWGVAGGRGNVHDSGADLFGVWHGIYLLANFSFGAAGRVARRVVYDSAASAAHRERAWEPDVS